MVQTSRTRRGIIGLALPVLLACNVQPTISEGSLRRPGPALDQGQSVGNQPAQRNWQHAIGSRCEVHVHRQDSEHRHRLSLEDAGIRSWDEGAHVGALAAAGQTLALLKLRSEPDAVPRRQLSVMSEGQPLVQLDRHGGDEAGAPSFEATQSLGLAVSEHAIEGGSGHSWVVVFEPGSAVEVRATPYLCQDGGCAAAGDPIEGVVERASKPDGGTWLLTAETATYLGVAPQRLESERFEVALAKRVVPDDGRVLARSADTRVLALTADELDLLILEPEAERIVQRRLLGTGALEVEMTLDGGSPVALECPSDRGWASCGAAAGDAGLVAGQRIVQFAAAGDQVVLALDSGCVLLADLERSTVRALGSPGLGEDVQLAIADDGSTVGVFSAASQEVALYAWPSQQVDGGVTSDADAGSDAGSPSTTASAYRVCLPSAPHKLYLEERAGLAIVGYDAVSTAPIGSGYSIIDLNSRQVRAHDPATARHILVGVGFAPYGASDRAAALALRDPIRGRHLTRLIGSGASRDLDFAMAHAPLALVSSSSCAYFGVLQDHPDGLLTTFSWRETARAECDSFDLRTRAVLDRRDSGQRVSVHDATCQRSVP